MQFVMFYQHLGLSSCSFNIIRIQLLVVQIQLLAHHKILHARIGGGCTPRFVLKRVLWCIRLSMVHHTPDKGWWYMHTIHHRQYTITSLTITLSLHCPPLGLLQLPSSFSLSSNSPSKFSTLKQSHSQCLGIICV